jgi:hypothetical protein
MITIELNWIDRENTAGRLLYDAVGTHEGLAGAADPRAAARVRGERNGLIRALALLIDAPLYAGTRYGLLTGSSVWRHLWDDVTAIVTNPDTGRGGGGFYDEHGTRRGRAMADLVDGWPTRRDALIAERRPS